VKPEILRELASRKNISARTVYTGLDGLGQSTAEFIQLGVTTALGSWFDVAGSYYSISYDSGLAKHGFKAAPPMRYRPELWTDRENPTSERSQNHARPQHCRRQV
jgi:hypothetical protein